MLAHSSRNDGSRPAHALTAASPRAVSARDSHAPSDAFSSRSSAACEPPLPSAYW
jgi:hypothetical protein